MTTLSFGVGTAEHTRARVLRTLTPRASEQRRAAQFVRVKQQGGALSSIFGNTLTPSQVCVSFRLHTQQDLLPPGGTEKNVCFFCQYIQYKTPSVSLRQRMSLVSSSRPCRLAPASRRRCAARRAAATAAAAAATAPEELTSPKLGLRVTVTTLPNSRRRLRCAVSCQRPLLRSQLFVLVPRFPCRCSSRATTPRWPS